VRGSLGEKIGDGAWSDVHAWAPGQVVKLFKAGLPQRHAWWEARMTRAAFAAAAPAPEVFDEVTVAGRFGVVLQRLDGPTLAQLSRSGAMTAEQVGSILATLAMEVHLTTPPPEVLPLRATEAGSSRFSGGVIPEHIATGILALIERLPPGDGLCHGDLHAGNVIMTTDGPKLVDWGGATRAPPGLDLAISHFLLSEVTPENVPDPERPRAYLAAMWSEYARLAGMSPAALTAAMEPYLPIIQVRFLLGPAASPALRGRLLRRVEATLRSRD
jgi:hypothetical protein